MSIRIPLSRCFSSPTKSAIVGLVFLLALCANGRHVSAQIHALPANTAVESPAIESRLVVAYNTEELVAPETHRVPHARQYEGDCWTWQLQPDGFMYPAYLAGGRESRMGTTWVYEREQGWLWDMAVGGRFGLFRKGTTGAIMPQGWQVDIEGAAFPRLDPEDSRSFVACDFRFGVPLTVRSGRWEGKLAYYHLSSHLGDEYMVMHSTLDRINYSRDVFVLGVAFRPRPTVRLYTEAGWAFYTDGGSKPWEFQFGVDWSSPYPTTSTGLPFLAINGRLRQEVDYGGNMTVEAGWQWRGRTGKLIRLGLRYFNGMSDQAQFFRTFESQFGMGAWLDY